MPNRIKLIDFCIQEELFIKPVLNPSDSALTADYVIMKADEKHMELNKKIKEAFEKALEDARS